MTINIPSSAIDAGIPKGDFDNFVLPPGLLMGDEPSVMAEGETFGASLTYPAYTVVGRVTSSGAVIQSVRTASDGSQNPIGFIAIGVTTGSSGSAKVPVYKAGVFNPNALVWDASWDTDERKRLAFKAGAPMILIVAPKTADV